MRVRALALSVLVLAAIPAVLPARAAGPYPEAIEWSPTGANEALDGPILLTWTARMDTDSVEAAFGLTDGNSTWTAADFQWTHSITPPWTSEGIPLAPLPARSDVLVVVASTAKDSAGYRLDQDGDGVGGEMNDTLTWTFRTENGTPPRVIGHIPASLEGNVSVDANITLAFDEPMDRASVEAAFHISFEDSGTFAWDSEGTTVAFDPRLKLVYNTRYNVFLGNPIAKDANGAPLDGNGDGVGGDGFVFEFMTEGNPEPPAVLAVDPPPGTPNVSVTTTFTIQFSESVSLLAPETFLYTDGTTSWTGRGGEFSWTGRVFPRDTVTFNPFANLPFAATITATLNASETRDRDGVTLDGNGNGIADGSPVDNYAWSFGTEATDATPPAISAVDPADGATGVPETTSVAVTFSEAMNRPAVEDAFLLQDPVRTWTKANGWFSWSPGDDHFTYTPSAILGFDQGYTVAVAVSATDVNGNPLDPTFLSAFRTRPEPDTTPPSVVSTFPEGDATGVDREVRLAVTFDDAMARGPTEAAIGLSRSTGYDFFEVAVGDFAWDAQDHTVSFQALEPLDFEARYQVTVGQGAKDKAALPMNAPFAFAFTTAPWSGHVVGRVVHQEAPVVGATVRLGNLTTQTNGDGTFSFPSARAGSYELTVSRSGYETLRRTVTLSHRDAGPDFAQIDLGELHLAKAAGVSPFAVGAGLAAVLAGAVVITLLLRRLRPPPLDPFEDSEEDYEDDERGYS